ncbi:hypothetical protein ACKI1O_46685, partial [Streptomyces scabiei]
YLTHRDYIEEQIKNAKKIFNNPTGEENELGYLITDIFQLDLINAYNYSDESADKWYTLGRINNYLSSNMVNKEAVILADCFQTLFSYSSKNFAYTTPYNEESIKRSVKEKEAIEGDDWEKVFKNVIDLLNNVSSEAKKKREMIIENINKRGISFSDRRKYLLKLIPSKRDIAIYND